MTAQTPIQRDQVIRVLRKHRAELTERYNVGSLSIFGSVARGEAHPDSDVDVLVEFAHPVGLFAFIGLQQYLESLLGRKVDLSTPRSLRPRIKGRVLREAVRVI
jgi:predicted nucleotidyltransferase